MTRSLRRGSPLAAAALLLLSARATQAGSEPGPGDLEQALQAIVEGSPLAGARVGILVEEVGSGKVRYARDADVLLNPASNVKLFTTAAALARLGAEFRFSTEFLVDPGSRLPAVRTLYLRGKGDPSLVDERLWAIAGELAHLGLERVGELVVDDSYFDAQRIGPGFDQEGGDLPYLAPAGALSLDFNTVAVHVRPGNRVGVRGKVELEPACDHLEVENLTTTVVGSGRRRVMVSAEPLATGRMRIRVEGRIPLGSRPQATWRRIEGPALYAGSALKRLLELRGVKVGRVRAGTVEPGARLVHASESDPLAEIIRRLNKNSNNFVAEQLLKTLGAEVKGPPGTWAKGVAAVEDVLAEVGIPRGAYVMKNGSGLNDANRFSARQHVALLRHMYRRFPLQPEYLTSLPVAARDGTIRWRMEGTEAAGRLRAKTGTLENVTSLSGYVETAGGETLAFAILVNDYPGQHRAVIRAVDALGAAIAASGGPPAELRAAVAQAREPATPDLTASPAELAEKARTYAALGRAGDRRNVLFLRTALRAEPDPAVRLSIAESVYQSDPEGEAARRTFLEAISPEPAVLGRLWAAAAGASPAPVLPSLGDLAAEGAPDALARLVEVARASPQDPQLAAAIQETLASVAASAPEDLVKALRYAPPAQADLAVSALGAGLARSDEPDHPFPAALRALAGRDTELGAFARALAPRLEEATRAGAAARAAPALVPASGELGRGR